jgi:uncharacterized membrane protein
VSTQGSDSNQIQNRIVTAVIVIGVIVGLVLVIGAMNERNQDDECSVTIRDPRTGQVYCQVP